METAPPLADLLRRRRFRRLPTAWTSTARPGRAIWLIGGWAVPGLVVGGLATGLQAVRTTDGEVAWNWPTPKWAELSAMSDQVVDGVAVAVLVKEGSDRERTTAVGIEVGTGKELWSYRLTVDDPYSNTPYRWSGPAARAPALVPGRAVLQTGRWAVTLDLRTGTPLQPPWADPDSTSFEVVASGSDVLQVAHTEREITVRRLDLERGGVLAETPVPFGGKVESARVVHGAPLVLAVTGAGVHAPEDALFLFGSEGEVPTQLPLRGKKFEFHLTDSGLLEQELPMVRAGDLLLVPTRPSYGSDLHVTALDHRDGTVRWHWKSDGELLGLLPAGDSVLALHSYVPTPQEPGSSHVPGTPTRVTLLDLGTGKVRAKRRYGYYSPTGISYLDGTRLIRLSRYGGGTSAVELR
ncbi:hypothetical protein OHV05_24875 [Kitasatospora sp. NBC_00070]|uniref:outer membrane protein assembly factor BamB family protein n=1 Tax=Kitasatospora sp. NBC_00070 TaxID=2975962 RepID=UPI00324751B1